MRVCCNVCIEARYFSTARTTPKAGLPKCVSSPFCRILERSPVQPAGRPGYGASASRPGLPSHPGYKLLLIQHYRRQHHPRRRDRGNHGPRQARETADVAPKIGKGPAPPGSAAGRPSSSSRRPFRTRPLARGSCRRHSTAADKYTSTDLVYGSCAAADFIHQALLSPFGALPKVVNQTQFGKENPLEGLGLSP